MDELVINVMNTPVEAVESEFPVRVERYELVHRLCRGRNVPWRPGGAASTGGYSPTKRRLICARTVSNIPRRGCSRLNPARPSSAVLNPGTDKERPLTSKIAGLRLKTGDLISLELGGGGGWGDLPNASRSACCGMCINGYVSLEAARDIYAVVINPQDMSIDVAATAAIRPARAM